MHILKNSTKYLTNMSYQNPYPRKETTRLVTDVSKTDFAKIKSLRPEKGTVSTTLAILWKKLCHELERNGITDYARKTDFEHFVTDCVIIGGGVTLGPAPHAAVSDDGGATQAIHFNNPILEARRVELQKQGDTRRQHRGQPAKKGGGNG